MWESIQAWATHWPPFSVVFMGCRMIKLESWRCDQPSKVLRTKESRPIPPSGQSVIEMHLFSRACLGLYFMRLVTLFINTVLTIQMYLDTFVTKISQVISSDGNYECNKTLFRWCIHSDSFMNTSFGMRTYVLFIFKSLSIKSQV